MFCNNCGNQIDDNAVVCPYCGAATDKMAEVTGNTATNGGATKINVCAIVGFVLAIVGIVIEFFLSGLVGLFICIAGFVLGIVGTIGANKKGQNLKGLAIAAIVVGAIGIAVFIMLITFLAALIGAVA